MFVRGIVAKLSTLPDLKWFRRPPPDIGPEVWILGILLKFFLSFGLRSDGTVHRWILSRLVIRCQASRKPIQGVSSVDIPIATYTGVWCRIFVPTSVDPCKKLPLIIFYHGGGFALLAPNSRQYDTLRRRMSKMSNAVVMSVAYRLAPEHKFPAAYEDGFTTVEWVRSQSRNQPHKDFPAHLVDFSRVFISGDSAGGNLAHHVTVKAGASDMSPVTIAGAILVQPFFGGKARTESEIRFESGALNNVKHLDAFWRAFLPHDADRDHPSCNVTGPKAPPFLPMKLPKLLVVVGGMDALQDKAIVYAKAMQAAGKDCKVIFYEKAFHGAYLFSRLKPAIALHHEIDEFVNPSTEDGSYVTGNEAGSDYSGDRF